MSPLRTGSMAARAVDMLLAFAPWIGILSAFGAVIANSVFNRPDWAFGFVAGSALGMWASFLNLAREVKGHIAEQKGYLEAAGKHRFLVQKLLLDQANFEDDEKLPILLVLRSAFFNNAGIDEVFWARYCKYLLADIQKAKPTQRELLATASEVESALRDRKVVAHLPWAYPLMKDLFEDVVRPGTDTYKGIFTEADKASVIDIEELVFDLPLRSPRDVRRIFALPRDELRALPQSHREKLLKQLGEKHIQLRVLANPPADLPNIGIYSGIAYGELDPATKANIFHFDAGRVSAKVNEFSYLWEKSTELTVADLDLA